MSKANTSPAASRSSGCSEQTADRIRAYLASVHVPDDLGSATADYAWEQGRKLIERMAQSAKDLMAPSVRLSIEECADMLQFVQFVQPIKPCEFWKDPKDAPSQVVGYDFVLMTIEASLRESSLRRRCRR